jgi:mannosyltransferase OCH1-like enzyme/glycosyltransferase involved in cell wall biosynthesis
MDEPKRILIFSEYLPTWSLSGSRARLAAVVRGFHHRGYHVHFVVVQRQPAAIRVPADAAPFVRRLSRLELIDHPEFVPSLASLYFSGWTKPSPHPFERFRRRLLRRWSRTTDLTENVERLLRRERPDVVFIDHTWLTSLVLDLMPRHPTVCWAVDTHDCLHRRDDSLTGSGLPLEAGLTREEEAELLEPFDLVVAIQDEERRLFQEMLPQSRVVTLTHEQTVCPLPCKRPAVGFVGSDAAQNVHGLRDFLDGAWPAIARRRPDATLEISGEVGADEAIRRAAARDGRIRLRGVVPRLDDIYRGPAAMIAPLWIGSGLKIKLVEALAHGKATVASPTAAQGLPLAEFAEGERPFLIAQTPEDFVEPLVELLSDASLRRRYEANAAAFARQRFSAEAVWAEFDRALAQPLARTRREGSARAAAPPSVPAPEPTPAARALIPRIIHQTWKTREIPFEFLGCVDSWRRLHPDWEYRLWTDADNRRFIAERYPWFLAVYDAYPRAIQRADAIRYFLLHHFGGLYVDLDFQPRRSIDALLAGRTCVLGLESPVQARMNGRDEIVGNAIMACTPGHPFFSRVIHSLGNFASRTDGVMSSTGPFMMTQVYRAFDQLDLVHLAPAAQLYPLSMEQADRFRQTGSSEVDLSAAYAIHFHHGTWWRPSPTRAA